MERDDARLEQRWLGVAAAGAVAATLLGFLGATRQTPAAAGSQTPVVSPVQAAAPAPTYAQLAQGWQSANRKRQAAGVRQLTAPPVPTDHSHDEAAWRLAASTRSARRAFDGAPPQIPHPVDQRGYPACQVCHQRIAVIGDHTSPRPSHPPLASCTQCHVVMDTPVPSMPGLASTIPEENSFVGTPPPGKGARAWPGAPPQIPHTTWMRQQCASCHGALTGLHSSHPERQSCTQCHALSAQLDQHPDMPGLEGP